jgi:transcriptional regulator with XRE-family HTH domain
MARKSINEDFGRSIRATRIEKGLTQEAVAYKARIEQTTLSKIERGVHRPGPALASRIALALGLDPASVLAEMSARGDGLAGTPTSGPR